MSKFTLLAWLFVFWFSFTSGMAKESPQVQIAIEHSFDGKPLLIDSLRYKLKSGERFSISRLSYLLSHFAFETEDGQWVVSPDSLGYIDAGKRLLNFTVTLPRGEYRAMRFNVGLLPGPNHSDPAQFSAKHPLNPNHNQLHWTWAEGYIFLALEGRYYNADDELEGYVYHFANDNNRTEITLPLKLKHLKRSAVDLNFDLGLLTQFPTALAFKDDGNSSHSHEGDIIPEKIKSNLVSAFRVKRIYQSTAPTDVQKPKPFRLPEKITPHGFTMSKHFPIPDLPTDNPLIEERIALGKKLFFDTKLSRNKRISCSSCHMVGAGLSDSRRLSKGVGRGPTRRHSMPLFNLAWKHDFFWDGRVSTLRAQVLHPIEHPNEMDLPIPRLIERLKEDKEYTALFENAFSPGTIDSKSISFALENFLLSLVSYQSKFDKAMAGKATLTAQEKRGFELFMTEYEPRSKQYGADCFHCHGGALFTNHQFHNNGLVLKRDRGRGEFTRRAADNYKFATPSLRNVAKTAPFMHDGGLQTLEDVIDHYSEGIQFSNTLDPNLAKHPKAGIQLSPEDKRALVAFLKTLTDSRFEEKL